MPTLILNIDEAQQHAKGSARSIEQVSMFEILTEHASLIDKFGGHHMAAGMTLAIENVEPLRQALNASMAEIEQTTSLEPRKHVDTTIEESEITLKNIQDIQRLRPFGSDFTSPCFELEDVIVQQAKAIGQDKKHLKLTMGEEKLQAIFWQNGHLVQELGDGQPINVIGTLQINEWNGFQSPQFMIQDLANNSLQILDYRSKSKVNQFQGDEADIAYLVHQSSDKVADNYYVYGETIEQDYNKYVLRDLPKSINHLKIH